jgi:hypothetical protein
MAGIDQLLLAQQFEQHGNALAGNRLEPAFKAIQRRDLESQLLAMPQWVQFGITRYFSLILRV